MESMANIFQRLGSQYPKEDAFLYGAAMDGIMLHYMQMEESYPVDEMKAFVLKRFLPDKFD